MDDEMQAGAALDAEVARVVMGRDPKDCGLCPKGRDGSQCRHARAYSTEMTAAWTVAEKLRSIGLGIIVSNEPDGWEVEICTTEALYRQGYGGCYAKADSAAEAICRAALMSARQSATTTT